MPSKNINFEAFNLFMLNLLKTLKISHKTARAFMHTFCRSKSKENFEEEKNKVCTMFFFVQPSFQKVFFIFIYEQFPYLLGVLVGKFFYNLMTV